MYYYFFYLILHICALLKNLCNISVYLSFVMPLPEDGHMIGQNM